MKKYFLFLLLRGDAIAALEAAVRLDPSFELVRDELARMREEASGASR